MVFWESDFLVDSSDFVSGTGIEFNDFSIATLDEESETLR